MGIIRILLSLMAYQDLERFTAHFLAGKGRLLEMLSDAGLM